jgi:hypothetical protein
LLFGAQAIEDADYASNFWFHGHPFRAAPVPLRFSASLFLSVVLLLEHLTLDLQLIVLVLKLLQAR